MEFGGKPRYKFEISTMHACPDKDNANGPIMLIEIFFASWLANQDCLTG